MTHRGSVLLVLAVVGCGEASAPPTPPTVAPVVTVPEAPTPPIPPPSAPPIAPEVAPRVGVVGGDVHELSPERYDDGHFTLLVTVGDAPRPAGRVVAYTELHHAHWEFREIEVLAASPYASAVTVSHRDSRLTRCEAPIRRARRLHATLISDDDGAEGPQTTFLGLEFTGCPHADLAVAGVPLADVSAQSLARTQLAEHAPLELVDLVLGRDAIYGEAVAAVDFRMLALPAYNLQIVVGENAWLIREGRVLSFSGNPTYIVQAGPRAFFWLDSPSDSWSAPLDFAHPAYDPGSCEVIDTSGTPTNVRAAPSGRSAVVTTVTRGTTVAADDQTGSWYRLLTTPPGWAHASGLRCTELPVHRSTFRY